MKNVTVADFILAMQDEYRARFGEINSIENVTFLRDLRVDQQETTELIMALAAKWDVPVNKGRMHDEFLKKGTFYNVQDLQEEFLRVSMIVDGHNYRRKWWIIGGGVVALSFYCLTQALPVHATVIMMGAGAIFERLRGMPRVL